MSLLQWIIIGNYLNGTTIYVNEFMALGHVPYDLQMLEVMRLVPKVNRIILQRAPCEHPTLCLGMNPWDGWFKGFYKAAAMAFQPNITVYRRSFKSEPLWTPEKWGSVSDSEENYTLKTSFNMLCFERVIFNELPSGAGEQPQHLQRSAMNRIIPYI